MLTLQARELVEDRPPELRAIDLRSAARGACSILPSACQIQKDSVPLHTPRGELTEQRIVEIDYCIGNAVAYAIEYHGRRNADARTFIQGAGKALLRVGIMASTPDTARLWRQDGEWIRGGRMPARSACGVRVPREQQRRAALPSGQDLRGVHVSRGGLGAEQ